MGNKSKLACMAVIILVTVLLWRFIDLLPVIGDPNSEPNTHISKVFIEKGPSQTNSPNLVTGVLADYRGLDTMLETTVIYLASIAVTLIMANNPKKTLKINAFQRIEKFGATEIRVVMPVVIPAILVYAVYVLVHGEVSLGGGFQAGALFALAYILNLFVGDSQARKVHISQYQSLCIGAGGLLIYFMTGLIPTFNGGNFLEYGALPLPFIHEAERHSIGIFFIELGVTICVASSIITILEAILERKEIDDRT